MIFFINDSINETNQPVAILAKVTDTNQGTAHCGFKEMLTNSSNLQSLAYNGEIVRLTSIEGYDKVLTWCDPNTSANFTSIAKILAPKVDVELPVGVFENIAKTINAQVATLQVDSKDIQEFFKAFKVYLDYKKNGLSEKIDYSPEFLLNKATTLALIEELNVRNSLSYLAPERNKTLFMNTPEEPVRIKLPSYEQITVGEVISLPRPSTVFKPYENSALFTPRYKDCLGDTDIKMVTGDVTNNDLEIQPNEIEFYNDLKELIEFGIKQRYPNVTLEDCLKSGYDDPNVTDCLIDIACSVAAWNWSHTGNYPVQKGLYGLDNDDDDFDDNGNESESESTEGSKTYAKDPNEVNDSFVNFDAEYFLKAYINKALQGGNSYAPAEAIIKLLRWGNRKPSRLKLNGVNNYLDLNTFKLQEMSGSYDNLEVVKVEGATYDILGIVTAMDKFKDMSYIKSLGYETNSLNIPVGVVAVKTYKGGIEQLVVFSIPSLLKFLENHDGDIRGIHIRDYKVMTSLEFEESMPIQSIISAVSKSANGEKIFYRSEEMLDMYMAYQSLTSATSELTILQKFIGMSDVSGELTSKSFKDSTELLEKYSIENNLNLDIAAVSKSKNFLRGMTGLRDYFDATVAKDLLPVILDVANSNYQTRLAGKESSFAEILNFYMLAMTKYNYDTRNRLQEDGTISEGSTAGKIANDIQTMSSFGENNAEPEKVVEATKTETVTPPTSQPAPAQATTPSTGFAEELLLAIPENTPLIGLYYNDDKTGQITLGYLAQIEDSTGKKRYALTSEPGSRPVVKQMRAEQIVRAALLDYYKVAVGNIASTNLRFDSMKSWGDIAKAIATHIK